MEIQLTPVEVRVLGALIEKERTTPEYYPLSLNALANACNQKSNREPVVSYSEEAVLEAIDGLRHKELALLVTGAGSRVSKYKHTFAKTFQLNEREVAALCVLMLRGPQTVGEIRGRSGRLYDFSDLAEVTETLDSLMNRAQGAYVMQLPRQTGRKEVRYAHLLSGEPELSNDPVELMSEAATVESERISLLESEVEGLRNELEALKEEFKEFKKQFD